MNNLIITYFKYYQIIYKFISQINQFSEKIWENQFLITIFCFLRILQKSQSALIFRNGGSIILTNLLHTLNLVPVWIYFQKLFWLPNLGFTQRHANTQFFWINYFEKKNQFEVPKAILRKLHFSPFLVESSDILFKKNTYFK